MANNYKLGVRRQFLGVRSHLLPCGTGDQTQVFRIGGNHLYPVSHLAEATVQFLFDDVSRVRPASMAAGKSLVPMSNHQHHMGSGLGKHYGKQ